MNEFILRQIGHIENDGEEARVVLDPAYRDALTALEGFSHIQLIWWFDGCDNDACRSNLIEDKPYKNAPERIGVFATRSPMRPNPIALSCAYVTYIDRESGVIGLAYCDANDGTPVLDIKPYTPSADRVEHPSMPDWCAAWPKCSEESGDFDWGSVFNF